MTRVEMFRLRLSIICEKQRILAQQQLDAQQALEYKHRRQFLSLVHRERAIVLKLQELEDTKLTPAERGERR